MLPLRDARPTRRTPVITGALLLACSLVFGYELLLLVTGGTPALNRFLFHHGLVAADLAGAFRDGNLLAATNLDVLTHMFLHAGWLHLMGNALFLWIFAPNVEDRLGRLTFLAFYLLGGLGAAAGQVLADPASDMPMIGASGAISAVLGAYLVLYPRARIQSLVFLVFFYELIAVPSVIVLGFWFLLQLIDGFASLGLTAEASGGIAFWAHIGGFLTGVALAIPLRFLRPAPPPPPEPAPVLEPAPAPAPSPGPPPPPPPPSR